LWGGHPACPGGNLFIPTYLEVTISTIRQILYIYLSF
jgi:hypothetical protein